MEYIKAYSVLKDISVIMALRVRAILAYFLFSNRAASLFFDMDMVFIVA